MRALRSLLRRFRRREDGAVTVEFVILFPLFVLLTCTGIEMGVLTLRQVMLERGVDITVRALRIGSLADPTYEDVRDMICANATLIPDCERQLHLELTPISRTTWSVPATAPTCIDRTEEIEPVLGFAQGRRGQFMLLRACSVFDPFFPSFGLAPSLPLDASGGYRLIASSAFVNEP